MGAPPTPPPPFCEPESVPGARVAARPSGTDSKWVEQDAAARRRGAGTGDARGRRERRGARLVSREAGDFPR